jgi:hypothetical protein
MTSARSKDEGKRSAHKHRATFTEVEVNALREILIEWLGEQLSIQPFSADVEGLVEKLDIPEAVLVANRERTIPLPNMV